MSQATEGVIGDLITAGENRYRLDPRVVMVNYWRFSDAVAAGQDLQPNRNAR